MYIIILSLISSLVILKTKKIKLDKFYRFLIFFLGFAIIIISELSYKFVGQELELEIFSISLPIIFIIFFYLYILIKSNFKTNHL